MNLTNQQKDLLLLLVSKHESTAGRPSIFVRELNAAALCYPAGDPVGVAYDESDLRRLQRERLVALIPVTENQLSGKPTQLGIEMVRRGFFTKRVMAEYETRCPLLGAGEQERLNQCGEQREVEVSRRIELAAVSIRARREEIKQITDGRQREVAEATLHRETATLRRGIIRAAETLVTEGVREFANCLVSSQGKLGGRAVLLREYTARFASEIRYWLSVSEVFQMEPLLPWREDSITQQAIRTCEDILAERKRIEGGGPSNKEEIEGGLAGQNENKPRTWSPIVQEWEALKSARRLVTDEHERIPETDLRSILAGQYRVKPEDVTDGQIEYAALELCRHYSRVQIIPSAVHDLDSAAESQKVGPVPDAGFWKEREDEFRRHETEENKTLGATWFSSGDYWTFHAGSGKSPSAKSIDSFKSVARDAAKGLGSKQGSKSWMDWLDLLRCAKDEDAGDFLYPKHYTGSQLMSERAIETGEAIPAGGLIEFVGTEDGGIERRMYWDTSGVTVDRLFKSSASLCLRFRSLAPHSRLETGAEGSTVTKETKSDKEAEFQADSWKDVEISFFNEHSIQITADRIKATHDFGRLGMAHERSGKPKRAWQMLHALAASNGILKHATASDSNWETVEKRIQELRIWLRGLFGISAEPLPYIKGVGYRAEFKISLAPSYRK